MDADAEIAALKQQVERLRGNVSVARTEQRAFRIAFSAILGALRATHPQTADMIMTSLLAELNMLQGMGDSDLLRALDTLYQKTLTKDD